MSLFEWKDSYNVNVGIIDEQHKVLVSLLNNLHDSMSQGKGKEVLSVILNDLVNYTKTHFATEEKLMSQTVYTKTHSHMAEHEGLTKKAIELNDDYKNGKVTMSIEVLNFLKDWLKNHILVMDKELGQYLKSKAIS